MRPEKWWNKALRAFDPKLRITWGTEIAHFNRPFWVIEREIDGSFLEDWKTQRRLCIIENFGQDVLGECPTHIIVVVLKTEDGRARPFEWSDLEFLRANDTWKQGFRDRRSYAANVMKLQKEQEAAEKEKRVKEMGKAFEDAGYRFDKRRDGVYVTKRVMGKPIRKEMKRGEEAKGAKGSQVLIPTSQEVQLFKN